MCTFCLAKLFSVGIMATVMFGLALEKEFEMETEIKTLVYRDRAGETVSPKKLGKLHIAIIITAVLIAAALTAGTTAVIAGNDLNRTEREQTAQLAELENMVQQAKAAEEITETSDEAGNPNLSLVRLNIARQEDFLDLHCSMVESIEPEEEDTVISLLADDEEDMFIPMFEGIWDYTDTSDEEENDTATDENTAAVTGTENTDETAGQVAEGRLEEVEEITSKILAPDDSPSALSYKYNESMKLELSGAEVEILERIVEAEATDQDVYGRMLVANVVINRVNSKYFANTVENVVFEKISGSYQFSPVKDGRYYSVPVTDLTREAVSRVLDGEDYSQGALYFFERQRTSANKASWFENNLKYLFKYGCHEFYTEYKK